MAKLNSFLRLDLMTIKPYFTLKNLVVFAAVALFISLMGGGVSASVQVGMMLGTIFVSYPFAVGDRCDMDALYATLSVSRKTVVLGRYIFTFALNLCSVIFSLILASVGLAAAKFTGNSLSSAEAIWATFALAAVFIVVQAMQLPVFFKLGYAKAKFVSMIPFAALMAGFLAFNTIAKKSDILIRGSDWLVGMPGGGAAIGLIGGLVVCLIIVVSYSLSLVFYKKREF